jgi:arylformamidase
MRYCYVNETLGLDPEEAFRNSPLHQLPETASPLILALGGLETEEFRRQSCEFAWKWRARGLALEVVEIPRCQHFSIYDERADPESPLNRAVLRQMGLWNG